MYGAYGYSYGDDCYWLKQQALYTGSPFGGSDMKTCRLGYDY
jgi:hypothetical protein